MKEMMQDELAQYFVVNKELCISTGKISGQVAHGETIVCVEVLHKGNLPKGTKERFLEWFNDGKDQKKILLEGSEKQLRKLIELGWYPVYDNGLTEIPAGSLTVVASLPMLRSEANPHVKRLQTLKDRSGNVNVQS